MQSKKFVKWKQVALALKEFQSFLESKKVCKEVTETVIFRLKQITSRFKISFNSEKEAKTFADESSRELSRVINEKTLAHGIDKNTREVIQSNSKEIIFMAYRISQNKKNNSKITVIENANFNLLNISSLFDFLK